MAASVSTRKSYMLGTTPPVLSKNIVLNGYNKNKYKNIQPKSNARINSSNPIAQGLVALHAPGISLENLTGLTGPLNKINSPSLIVNNEFIGVSTSNSGNKYLSMDKPLGTILDITSPVSMFCLCYITTLPSSGGRAPLISTLNGTSGYAMEIANSEGIRFIYGTGSGTLDFTNGVLPSTGLHSFAAVFNYKPGDISSCNAFYDGKILFSGSRSTTFTGNSTAYALGSRPGIDTQTLDGVIFITATWNRVLTQSEVNSLHNNPWQLFSQPNKDIWVPV